MTKTTKEIVEKALYKRKISWIVDKNYQKIIGEKWYSEKEVKKAVNQTLGADEYWVERNNLLKMLGIE